MAKKEAALPLNKQMTRSSQPEPDGGMARLISPNTQSWVDKVAGDINAEAHMMRLFQEVRKNPTLSKCDPASLVGCAMEAGALGLSFGGLLGQAHAVPFWDGKGKMWKAQLIIGYQGYIRAMVDNVTTFGIKASWVCKGDALDYDLGTAWIKHKPPMVGRGEIQGSWAKAEHNNGVGTLVVVTLEDLEKTRDRSNSYANAKKNGYAHKTPWETDFGAMAQKTAIRRLAKLVPVGAGLERIMAADGVVSVGSPEEGIVESFNPEMERTIEAEDDVAF